MNPFQLRDATEIILPVVVAEAIAFCASVVGIAAIAMGIWP